MYYVHGLAISKKDEIPEEVQNAPTYGYLASIGLALVGLA